MNGLPFCTARVGEPVEDDVDFVDTDLPNADAVIEFLNDTYVRLANLVADWDTERSGDDEVHLSGRVHLSSIGGFGVQLTNRFGGEVEIALGPHFGLFIRLTPQPTRIYRNPVQDDGTLVFYLDGWHHTEMEMTKLATRSDCLTRLRQWLETNEFPNEE